MAQLIRLSLALLCCSVLVLSSEKHEDNYNDIVQFILNWHNEKSDSQHVYNSAKIVNAYKKNDSEPLYFLQLEVATNCNSSANCLSTSLICEVGVRENLSNNTKEVLSDRAKCAKKEIEPILPTSGHGFNEENITDEIRSIAAFAIQQSGNNGANKRSVIDIISVKRQVIGNATTLYLTLKVTKTEGGDTAQFEVCEADVNKTGEMAWESSLSCFPLNGLTSDAPINAEDITTVAERAADEMDSLSYSEFTLKLVDVLKAETTVTPGSEGTVSNLELRLAPTLCLKNVDVENDSYGLYGKRICPENGSNKRLICSVISWDRPWVDDTLYSEPSCREDTLNHVSNQTERTPEVVQNDSPDVMMNDQMEPENEEVFIPAVEHHSIPVVEELDPIIAQILPDIEKPGSPEIEESLTREIDEALMPVVEEPVIAKHIYCTGCPIDLDVNNPALDEFVEQALAVIDESSTGQNMYRATRITKAQKQVVNGVKYILHLEVAETTCRKDSGLNRGTCQTSNNEVKTCVVEFLEKPWIDSTREIVSNNCTKYNNDLENEIKPHFVSHSLSARQEIFDYLDEMDEPKPVPVEEYPSYGKDGLYTPDSEPTNHPIEHDAQEIEIKTSEDEQRQSDKSVMQKSSESSDDMKRESPVSVESKESEEKQRDVDKSSESGGSSEERKDNENLEEKIDEIASYITGESRNRRETSLTANYGALKEIGDAEKELVDKLALVAVKTLDEIDEDDKKRVVLEVLGAQKQIVNGIMYHLLLRIVSTSCSENGHSDPSCVNEQLSPVRICKIELHRSFASNSELDAKVVKSECTVENDNVSETKLRNKRNVNVVTGGISPANTSEPYIMQMAEFGVTELDKDTNSLYRQCIADIVRASKQVVSGYNIYLTLDLCDSIHRKGENISGTCQQESNAECRSCEIIIWDRPWIANSQRVTSSNCSSNSVRYKRETSDHHHTRLVGGPIDADTNDTYIQEIAVTALTEVDRRSNAMYKQQIVRVIEATKQVVSGVKVRLTMELGYTTCRKGTDANDCQINENSNNQICYIEVWDRPWLQDRRVTNVTCSPAPTASPTHAVESTNRAKRHVGGFSKVEVDDPYVLDLAKTALAEFDRKSNAMYKQKIVRIIEAQKQIVAGTLTKLIIEVGYSKCRKEHDVDVDTCELNDNSKNQICHVQIWDRPWLNKREIKKSSCNPSSVNKMKKKSFNHDFHFEAFQNFMDKYNKKYSSNVELKQRFHIFRANLKKIDHLQRTEQGTATYGITQFADLSRREFKKYHLGLNRNLKDNNEIPMQEAVIPNVELPKEFDWRHYNVVTEVKNQGSCGSCWAFSVTGNVEGQWAINKGKLLSLSEQELVDCDTLDDGCNGGLPENAYKSIEKLGGLETEGDYPYEGEDEKCHFQKTDVRVTIQGSVNITKNETKMAQWLYKNGPMSIGINANAMQFYVGGVSHPWKFLCNGDDLDHGVLIVGFGVHKTSILHRTLPYWTIKNSWGKHWGEQGYYRVYRGDGTCGVNQMVTSAIVG